MPATVDLDATRRDVFIGIPGASVALLDCRDLLLLKNQALEDVLAGRQRLQDGINCSLQRATFLAVIHEPYWIFSRPSPHIIRLSKLGIPNLAERVSEASLRVTEECTTAWQLDVLKDVGRLYRQALLKKGATECQFEQAD
ncbi:unnamed protein product [Schistocephalus solidus]|uniref:Uncharacterized protein n=1 Tax=Schistocephalus solidus TaxID=70667 RepID=A0A183TQ53_SCHSO|nr:unnamed protein product [Schistocephalus solidus]